MSELSFDELLVSYRRRLAIALAFSGRIDPESAIDLFESATDPAEIIEEREVAIAYFESGGVNLGKSPLGRRCNLFFKLPSGGKEVAS